MSVLLWMKPPCMELEYVAASEACRMAVLFNGFIPKFLVHDCTHRNRQCFCTDIDQESRISLDTKRISIRITSSKSAMSKNIDTVLSKGVHNGLLRRLFHD